MMDRKPYAATTAELRAIDEARRQPPVTDGEIAAYGRTFAKLLRAKADQAETPEMRVPLLDMAEQLEKLWKFLGARLAR